jgi:hypothetical protein
VVPQAGEVEGGGPFVCAADAGAAEGPRCAAVALGRGLDAGPPFDSLIIGQLLSLRPAGGGARITTRGLKVRVPFTLNSS